MTRPELLYLVGPPAAGKSTLMAALTAGAARSAVDRPVPHDIMAGGAAAEVGRRREEFSGTDALGMAVNPLAISWVATAPFPLLLAEGARLANKAFLYAALTAGYRVTLALLDTDQATLDRRCAERGSHQSVSWRRGAATRARRIAETMELDARVLRLDAAHHISDLAASLRVLVPALEVLRG